jgi:hypothetical protein
MSLPRHGSTLTVDELVDECGPHRISPSPLGEPGNVPVGRCVYSVDNLPWREVKIWLDDWRPAPYGWLHVRTPEEAIELLRTGEVEAISLDHDLGLDEGRLRERTGYDVLLWLEREVAAGRTTPPAEMRVHSGNVAVIKRMEQAVDSIRRLAEGGR